MTDHKFTDDDVIKALECCRGQGCKECPFNCNCATCIMTLQDSALALINRQKAEIERLETENKLLIENDVRNKYPNCVSVKKGRIYTCTLEDYDELIGDISAEAIKEFAERLNREAFLYQTDDYAFQVVAAKRIDILVKEMTEEQK